MTDLDEQDVDSTAIHSCAHTLETQDCRPTRSSCVEEFGNELLFVLRLLLLRDAGCKREDNRGRHRAGIDGETAGQHVRHIRR